MIWPTVGVKSLKGDMGIIAMAEQTKERRSQDMDSKRSQRKGNKSWTVYRQRKGSLD